MNPQPLQWYYAPDGGYEYWATSGPIDNDIIDDLREAVEWLKQEVFKIQEQYRLKGSSAGVFATAEIFPKIDTAFGCILDKQEKAKKMSDIIGIGRMDTQREISHCPTSELRLWLIQEISSVDRSVGWFVDACVKELKERGAIL